MFIKNLIYSILSIAILFFASAKYFNYQDFIYNPISQTIFLLIGITLLWYSLSNLLFYSLINKSETKKFLKGADNVLSEIEKSNIVYIHIAIFIGTAILFGGIVGVIYLSQFA